MPVWLPENAIIAIHGELLAEHGGLGGADEENSINKNALGSTLARPQQLENYSNPIPTLFQLAASYGFGFAKNHCFKDGNKRVALVAVDVFLELNGYELNASEVDAVYTIEGLSSSEITENELATWIEANSQRLEIEL
jgi:death on curing protein